MVSRAWNAHHDAAPVRTGPFHPARSPAPGTAGASCSAPHARQPRALNPDWPEILFHPRIRPASPMPHEMTLPVRRAVPVRRRSASSSPRVPVQGVPGRRAAPGGFGGRSGRRTPGNDTLAHVRGAAQHMRSVTRSPHLTCGASPLLSFRPTSPRDAAASFLRVVCEAGRGTGKARPRKLRGGRAPGPGSLAGPGRCRTDGAEAL